MPYSIKDRAKNRLFWKIGIVFLLLFLLVLISLDLFVVRALKQEYLETAFSQLEFLSRLALKKPPRSSDLSVLREWADGLSESGVRVTLVARDGTVFADSKENPSRMENHKDRPEIKAAFGSGSGRAVRHSATLGHDLVYYAQSFQLYGERLMVLKDRQHKLLSGYIFSQVAGS